MLVGISFAALITGVACFLHWSLVPSLSPVPNWTDRSVLVSGAGSGVGRHTALALNQLGWTVFAGVRTQKDVDRLKSEHPSIRPVLLDVTNAEHIANLSLPGLCGYVDSAGVGVRHLPMEALTDDEEWKHMYDVNIHGFRRLVQRLLPQLRNCNGARIVTMGSVLGSFVIPSWSADASTNYALEALVDSLRLELSEAPISVSLIKAGYIESGLYDKDRFSAELDPAVEALLEPYGGIEQYRLSEARIRSVGKGGGSLDQAYDVIHKALTSDRPQSRYYVGSNNEWSAFMLTRLQFLPDVWFDRVIRATATRRGDMKY